MVHHRVGQLHPSPHPSRHMTAASRDAASHAHAVWGSFSLCVHFPLATGARGLQLVSRYQAAIHAASVRKLRDLSTGRTWRGNFPSSVADWICFNMAGAVA